MKLAFGVACGAAVGFAVTVRFENPDSGGNDLNRNSSIAVKRPNESGEVNSNFARTVQTLKLKAPSAQQLDSQEAIKLASPAPPNCDGFLPRVRATADALVVTVEGADNARVGDSIKLRWRNTQIAQLGNLDDVSVYFIVTTASEVRFAGTGFMALTSSARAPGNLSYGSQRARALFPLNPILGHEKAFPLYRRDTQKKELDPQSGTYRSEPANEEDPSRGEISVIPYRYGVPEMTWAIVTTGRCGEHLLSEVRNSINPTAGAPQIVVQDRFVSSEPKQRIRSNSGQYDLVVFDGRYEVYEVATGAKIVDHPGIDPNFSPGSRFVAARRNSDNQFVVIDLVSGQDIASDVRDTEWELLADGFLAWAREDSYLVISGTRWRYLYVRSTIVDDGVVLQTNNSGHYVPGWSSQKVVIDVDRGFADFERTETDPAIETWELGETLTLSHIPAPDYWKYSNSPKDHAAQLRHLAHHVLNPAAPAASAAGTTDLLHGRPRSGRHAAEARFTASRQTPANTSIESLPDRIADSLVFTRIAAAGIRTVTLGKLDRVYNDPTSENTGETTAPKTIGMFNLPARFLTQTQVKQVEHKRLIAQKIQAQVPAVKSIESSPCLFPDEITQVWRWQADARDYWLIQVICHDGSGGFPNVLFFMLRTGWPLGRWDESGSTAVTELMETLDDRVIGIMHASALRAQVSRVADKLIAIVIPGRDLAAVIDVDTLKRVAYIQLRDSSLFSRLRLTSDAKHLVQLNKDGRFYVHRVADGHLVLTGIHVDDEIVVATDDGLYDTTFEGAQSVQIRFPGISGLYRFYQFEAALRRPGLARAVLAEQSTSPPPERFIAPPTVELTLAASPINGRRIGKVLATAEENLSSVRLYLDGRLVQVIPVRGRQAEAKVELPDPGGARWISAVAIDADGTASLPSAIQVPGPARPRGTLRSVLIGVDNYGDPGLPRLAGAKADAQNLARALKTIERRAVSAVKTKLLVDNQVSREAVLQAVREAALSTMSDDTLVIFYAGHGVAHHAEEKSAPSLMLTTPATRLAELTVTAVPWAELAQNLNEAQGTVVIILDACHAGLAGSDAFATNDDVVSTLFTRSGAPMVVLAGSKGRQFSLENPNANGGLFTAAIVSVIDGQRALHDRDHSGLIDLGELYAAVKTKVMGASNGQQTPWLTRNGLVGEMSLF
jgi:hypothetical protein